MGTSDAIQEINCLTYCTFSSDYWVWYSHKIHNSWSKDDTYKTKTLVQGIQGEPTLNKGNLDGSEFCSNNTYNGEQSKPPFWPFMK